jgi:MFS family permease
MHGAAYGIARFLDALGAVTGILAALLFGVGQGAMTLAMFHRLVWLAIPFGLLSIALLVLWVPRVTRLTHAKATLAWTMPREIRGYLGAVGIFALGNSSDAFLVLKAHELGFSFSQILMVMLLFNALAAGLAVPVGKLTDKVGRSKILAAGWITYAATYAVFGLSNSPIAFVLALFIYGAFYGFTEGTEKALLADLLPAAKRGAGFGSLQLILGITALPASLLTGWLMTVYGSAVAFCTAAGFAIAGTLVFSLWRWRRRR